MKARDFCYWLQGYFEIGAAGKAGITDGQIEIIRRHLALVFKHDIDEPDPTGDLQATHDGKPPLSPPLDGTLYRC